MNKVLLFFLQDFSLQTKKIKPQINIINIDNSSINIDNIYYLIAGLYTN